MEFYRKPSQRAEHFHAPTRIGLDLDSPVWYTIIRPKRMANLTSTITFPMNTNMARRIGSRCTITGNNGQGETRTIVNLHLHNEMEESKPV